jgi:hypothetical protein
VVSGIEPIERRGIYRPDWGTQSGISNLMMDVAESEDEDRAESGDGGEEHETNGIEEDWRSLGGWPEGGLWKEKDEIRKTNTVHITQEMH